MPFNAYLIGLQHIDLSHADLHHSKRVFLLGPSHHHYLERGALTRCTHYGTPLGNLLIDAATTAELHSTGKFDWMSQDVDEDEHSLEMHLPYIHKMLSRYHSTCHETNFEPTDIFSVSMVTTYLLWSPS